ncbi:hypothetical protein RHGRI_009301 [Rhododendron griersonianum]|uniref:Uncharacterized protein n=1 Tax=Rhododendron griersonianum TaxID=479676 RepID=A0AAV6L5T3_9ERIC|nr:hypothetical protein RHGRI_009301 [Rhododendron griersonianum]
MASASTGGGEAAIGGEGVDSLRNDACTVAGLGDLEKLRRLVECEGCSVSKPDGQGYYALQWAALSVRPAEAQYIIEWQRCGDCFGGVVFVIVLVLAEVELW